MIDSFEKPSRLLESLIRLLIESKMKNLGEVDLADGRKVEFGSEHHISDLAERISDMSRYRNRHKRGSSARENYSRTISRLKIEMAKAQRVSQKRIQEKETVKKR